MFHEFNFYTYFHLDKVSISRNNYSPISSHISLLRNTEPLKFSCL